MLGANAVPARLFFRSAFWKKLGSYTFYIGSAFYFRFCWVLMTITSMVFMVTVAGLNPLQMVLVGTVLEFPMIMDLDPIIWWVVMSAGSTIIAFAALDIVRLGCGYIQLSTSRDRPNAKFCIARWDHVVICTCRELCRRTALLLCHSKGRIYQSCSVSLDYSSDSCHCFV